MRKLTMSLVLGALMFAPMGLDAKTIRSFDKSFPATGVARVSIEVPVGSLLVHSHDADIIQVDVIIKSSHDEKAVEDMARDIELVSDKSGDRLDLEIKGYPKWDKESIEVEVTMRVPARMALGIEVGVGEAHVRGTSGDLTAKVGVGEVEVAMKQAAVHSASATAGVGGASIRLPDDKVVSKGFIGQKASWTEGKGTARVELEAGVGEATLKLE